MTFLAEAHAFQQLNGGDILCINSRRVWGHSKMLTHGQRKVGIKAC